MPHSEPAWWYHDEPTWQTRALRPASWLYGSIASARFKRRRPYKSRLPVICAGNFTAGGTGKTPLAIAVADMVKAAGRAPWFLSRGFGGRLDGQEQVDPAKHHAAEVGDEPLLLAQRAPTVISRNRRHGAEFIERHAPANAVIIMDDGLQNPQLHKDLRLAVVDAARGLGNGRVIPAGPLRAPMAFQAGLADAIILTGRTSANQTPAGLPELPIIRAITVPAGDTAWLKDKSVVAFAGIANPDRFFHLLESLGAKIVTRRAYPDHQSLQQDEAADLLRIARGQGAHLITTEKDFVRLSGPQQGPLNELRALTRTLQIATAFESSERAKLESLVLKALKN